MFPVANAVNAGGVVDTPAVVYVTQPVLFWARSAVPPSVKVYRCVPVLATWNPIVVKLFEKALASPKYATWEV